MVVCLVGYVCVLSGYGCGGDFFGGFGVGWCGRLVFGVNLVGLSGGGLCGGCV